MITVDRLSADELPVELALSLARLSLFSSPAFASLWKTIGGTDVYWVASEAGRLRAVLSGVEWRHWPIARFQSMPHGLYARMYVDPEAGNSAAKITKELVRKIVHAGYAKISIHDYHLALPRPVGFEQLTSTTTLVDISHSDWEPPDRTVKQEVRRAEREGVQARGFNIEQDLDPFLALAVAVDVRIGRRPKYSPPFFKALARLALEDKRARWNVAQIGGRLVASHIYFIDGNMSLVWQTYFDKSVPQLKPNPFLLLKSIEQLVSEGVKFLNLGATPDRASGVAAFKEKWGGVTYEYPWYRHHTLLGRLW